jgi:hypothetical protein
MYLRNWSWLAVIRLRNNSLSEFGNSGTEKPSPSERGLIGEEHAPHRLVFH